MLTDEKQGNTNRTSRVSNETAVQRTCPNNDSDPITTKESTTKKRQNFLTSTGEMKSTKNWMETTFSPGPPEGKMEKTLSPKKLEEWIKITPGIYAEPMCVISRAVLSNVKLAANDTYINWKCEIYYCNLEGELKNYKCEFLNSEAGHKVDVNLDGALAKCKQIRCI